jgi:hypothetical protein
MPVMRKIMTEIKNVYSNEEITCYITTHLPYVWEKVVDTCIDLGS